MRVFTYLFACASLMACQSAYNNPQKEILDDAPASWVSTKLQSTSANRNDDWYSAYLISEQSGRLSSLIERALSHNLSIQNQQLALLSQEKTLSNAQADFWPSLSLDFDARRQQGSDSLSSSHSLDLSASYELDVWGKLRAQEKVQALNYLSLQADLENSKQTVISQVITFYIQILEANQLYELYSKRAKNSQQNLDIIDSGYKQGLSSALDVYLARNELNSDLATVAEQQNARQVLVRQLENLLGFYPEGALQYNGSIPSISAALHTGIPTDIVKHNPSVQVQWLQLLAANEQIAVAHKLRFPSVQLSASVGKASDDISELFSSDIVWSLLGSVVTPIFNAGTLRNNEDIAAIAAQQVELDYLTELRSAFLAVENALFQEQSLQTRYVYLKEAQENAIAAEELAFEQYQKGLITYTTVLEAQTRSVNAQSSLIGISSDLFTNRIALNVALGSPLYNIN